MEVHSGHGGGGVMHGLPGPGLHDGAPPSELIYPRRPRALPLHTSTSRAAVCRSQEWNVTARFTPPRADAVVQIKRVDGLV